MLGGLTKPSSGCFSFQLPGIVLVPWRCLAAIVTHQTPTCSSLMLRGSGRWLQFKFWQSVCLMCVLLLIIFLAWLITSWCLLVFLLCSCSACVRCDLLCVCVCCEYVSGHFIIIFYYYLYSFWENECVGLSLNQPPSHTLKHIYSHPTQATLPPKAALLSLFFHHTALEVSPATSGTSCSPTALAPSLRARGNTATPKHPAAAPMTSGSHVPKSPGRNCCRSTASDSKQKAITIDSTLLGGYILYYTSFYSSF